MKPALLYIPRWYCTLPLVYFSLALYGKREVVGAHLYGKLTSSTSSLFELPSFELSSFELSSFELGLLFFLFTLKLLHPQGFGSRGGLQTLQGVYRNLLRMSIVYSAILAAQAKLPHPCLWYLLPRLILNLTPWGCCSKSWLIEPCSLITNSTTN